MDIDKILLYFWYSILALMWWVAKQLYSYVKWKKFVRWFFIANIVISMIIWTAVWASLPENFLARDSIIVISWISSNQILEFIENDWVEIIKKFFIKKLW